MICKYCKDVLTKDNTSPLSEGREMCQECHIDLVESAGWEDLL